MNAGGLGAILVPIGTALVFALCRRLCPVRRWPDPEPPLTDEERKLFRRYECLSILPFFLIGAVLTFAWYSAFRAAPDQFQESTPGTLFLLRPIHVFWLIPSMFLGMVSSALLVTWLYRWWLGDRYRYFEQAGHERLGFDGDRVLAGMTVLIVLGSVAAFLAGVTTFTRFEEEGMTIGRTFSFHSAFYSYRRITLIEHRATVVAPNGNVIHRPHYVLTFDDGSSWSTHRGLRDPDPARDDTILRMVSARSRRKIVEKP